MKFSKLHYTSPYSKEDFKQMIALQKRNLPDNISKEEAKEQGFVTVKHTAEILEHMNELGGHAVAKDGNRIVGYTLFMSKELEQTIPILKPMFEQFKKVLYAGRSIYDCNYFVMGQVCVDKDYRGQGVFVELYNFLKQNNSKKYDFIVTEITTRNTRSMRAHEKVGFELVNIYTSEDGEEWAIVIWKI